jgi:hypothetical protein
MPVHRSRRRGDAPVQICQWGRAVESKRKGTFNAQAFLNSAGVARTIVEYRRADVIFKQDTPVRVQKISQETLAEMDGTT